MNKMLIRDAHSSINGVDEVHEMPSGGIDIINEQGETMFSINLEDERFLNISSGSICRIGDKVLDDRFVIIPIASNRFLLEKLIYKPT